MKRRDFIAAGLGAVSLMNSPGAAAVRRDGNLSMKIALAGDCVLTRRIVGIKDSRFQGVVRLLRSADCAIANCEMIFGNPDELEPSPKGSDMNLIADPRCADDLAWIGMDLMGCANNHVLDYGARGLMSTLQALRDAGIVTAGAGTTLARASSPSYADTPSGRVALVNCASTYPEWAIAEDTRRDSNGRSGVNGFRVDRIYQLEPDLFRKLMEINAALLAPERNAKTGDASQELSFVGQRFVEGNTGIVTRSNATDVERILSAVRIARRNANVVAVLIHEHGIHKPGEFLQVLARSCIDAGADLFFGAGPHELGAIEIYRNRPIFYSLGNFLFQYETLKQIPREVYEAYGIDVGETDASRAYEAMSEMYFNRRDAYWESVIPQIVFDGTHLSSVQLIPITLGQEKARFARGTPVLADGSYAEKILERLRKMSEPYGTEITTRDGIGVVGLGGAK